MIQLNKWIQNIFVAFIMSCSVTALFQSTSYFISKVELFNMPIIFIVIFILSMIVAEDVRDSFKKVLKFQQRNNHRELWQVGIGMIFFFAQVGAVEVFFRVLMKYQLEGMPLYFIFSFLNAFLFTIIYEEIFYKKCTTKNNISLKS